MKGEKNPQKSHSLFDKEKLVVEQDRKNVTRLIDLPKKKKKSKKGRQTAGRRNHSISFLDSDKRMPLSMCRDQAGEVYL